MASLYNLLTDIIDRGFDSQRQGEFVIHFDRHRTHAMLDEGAFNAGVEIVAHWVLIIAMQFAT